MKKLILVLMLLVSTVSYAQIWEGNGGKWLSEDLISYKSNDSGGGDDGSWEEYNPDYVMLSLYDTDGSLLYNPKFFPKGTEVNLVNAVPTKSGFIFDGWSNGGQIVNSIVMNSNTSLVAVWSEDSYVYGFEYEEFHGNSISLDSYPVTYTDDAVNLQPVSLVSGNVITYGDWEDVINSLITPVMLKSDGTVDYELDRNNQLLKADGSPSDISDQSYDGNAMIRIKKFYISITKNSDYKVSVKISNRKIDSTYTCYGFIDSNGNEHDYAYYGMFFGSNISNKLRSISGIQYSNMTQIATARTLARANGTGWDIDNISLYNAISLLHVLFLKTLSPETVLGTYDNFNTNFNDVLGTMNNCGAFYVGNSNALNSKSLWIESFWGVHMNWCNGLYCANADLYYKTSAPYDDNSTYTYAGKMIGNSYQTFASTRNLRVCDNLLLPTDEYPLSGTAYNHPNGYGGDYMSTRGTTGFMSTNGANNYHPYRMRGIWTRVGVGTLTGNMGARLTYLPAD